MPRGAMIAGLRGRRSVGLAVVLIAGGAYGFATSWIPAPADVRVFWIGNFCAPWLVLAFLAGRAQRSWRPAATAGLLVDTACVAGFYVRFLTLDPRKLGLPPSTTLLNTAVVSLDRWASFIGAWVAVALCGGAVYGALGYLWRRGQHLAAGLALAAPFVAEPALWPLYHGYYQGPWPLWAMEASVGVALAVGVALTYRRRVTSSAR